MSAKGSGTIIIKRVKKGGHSHHGGAWKVAYADFVTAMMAFFLLLWLLNAATKEQLQGISDYFAPVSYKASTSGGGGLLAGKTVAKMGVFEDDSPRSQEGSRTQPGEKNAPPPAPEGSEDEDPPEELSEKAVQELLRKNEEEQFHVAQQQLRQAIAESSDLEGLSKSLIVDNTPEGLRIQIIDQEGLPMFPRGDSEMYAHTRKVLELVSQVIQRMPQNIDIAGHTDSTRYQGSAGYSNWELSADRANAVRRTLVQLGVPEGRIARVVGKAATDPLVASDPSAPGNRRLEVVLQRGTGRKSPSADGGGSANSGRGTAPPQGNVPPQRAAGRN